jgi:hypothetical protein
MVHSCSTLAFPAPPTDPLTNFPSFPRQVPVVQSQHIGFFAEQFDDLPLDGLLNYALQSLQSIPCWDDRCLALRK